MDDGRPSTFVTPTTREVWLRGPLEGFDPVLMPAAHALLQSAEDLERAAGTGEVLVELLRGIAGIVVVAARHGPQGARELGQLREQVAVVAGAVQDVRGDEPLVGRDEEDVADGGRVDGEARVGHGTILATRPRPGAHGTGSVDDMAPTPACAGTAGHARCNSVKPACAPVQAPAVRLGCVCVAS